MYKKASRNLQHAHRVDAPLPTGGYIGSAASNDDLIPSAGNMSRAECDAERKSLLLEKARAQNDLLAAKGAGDKVAIERIGLRIQGYCTRIAILKRRLHDLAQADEHQAFAQATRDLVDPETFRAIVARKAEIKAALIAGASA